MTMMKAVAVRPGVPDSMFLAQLPMPSVTEIPGGRGVLVKVLRVGVDGTDHEINAAEYGAPPAGYDFLVIGHEGFGQVVEVGPNVTEVAPGDYVVATVRRPGSSIYDLIGTNDMTTDDTYFERGINLRHGYLTEYYVDDAEFIVKVPRGLKRSACCWSRRRSSRRGSPRRTRSSVGCGSGARSGRPSWGPAPSACWRRWCCGSAGST